jgi:hypothetical protein
MYLTDSEFGVVTFDLDSTLCNTTERQKMIVEGFVDWEEYSLACSDDTDGPALPLAQYLSSIGAPIAICSARDAIARDKTLAWLAGRGVKPWLVVLNEGDCNGYNHGYWKAKKLVEIQERLGRKIVAHFDDISDVAVMTAKIGIKTILVHQPHSLGEILA